MFDQSKPKQQSSDKDAYSDQRNSTNQKDGQSDEQYQTIPPGGGVAPYAVNGLGRWNYYFLLKLFLFWRGSIGFHSLENMAFAAFLLITFSSKLANSLKSIAGVMMGVALFYHDTWLPSIARAWSQIEVIKGFSFSYFVELALRYISLEFIALAFLLWIVYQYFDKWVRTSVVVFLALMVMSYQTLFPGIAVDNDLLAGEPGDARLAQVDAMAGGFSASPGESLDTALTNFFNTEKLRKVDFPSQAGGFSPFDILVLNICSLSWDDLEYTGLHLHPVFNELDIVLSNFSSGASYSGPAAIRLMRASCGQLSHSELYEESPKHCFLFDNLKKLGFDNQVVMNHDGSFDNFSDLIEREGHFGQKPMDLTGVKVAQHSFDGTPIYSDLDTLSHWISKRNGNTNERVATYYNSISLHDGNRLAGAQANLNSLENFHPRMTTFLTELSLFFEQLKASNRRVMVVMVPEHGAAARGDPM
ncbi:MAG: cellulose biosynthesis protein BcsG, partial [Psychrosphaera sp.]|nr:cellulose biosynthesis protein BcsG [Psychrosphaera sp.]